MANAGEALQCCLFEPLEFLQGSCLQTARESVDYVLRSYPLSSFLPEQSYFRVPSERAAGDGSHTPTPGIAPTPGGGSGGLSGGAGVSLVGVGDLVAVNRAKDGIALAVSTARCWDSCKRVRGAMMVQQMLSAAKALASEVNVHSYVFVLVAKIRTHNATII